MDGATVSSTRLPSHALYHVADAVYPDPAFSNNWFAYQLKADSNEWSLGLSIPSGIDASINIAYSLFDISAVGGNEYLNRMLTVSYVHNF